MLLAGQANDHHWWDGVREDFHTVRSTFTVTAVPVRTPWNATRRYGGPSRGRTRKLYAGRLGPWSDVGRVLSLPS
jgi:hypothetical protein